MRPGFVFKLFTRHRAYTLMHPSRLPEMLRGPLQEICLSLRLAPLLADMTLREAFAKCLTAPPEGTVATAITGLQRTAALDENEALTPLGRHLAALPVDIGVGRLILYGSLLRCAQPILLIAAALSDRSPFLSPMHKRDEARASQQVFNAHQSDHLAVLEAHQRWEKEVKEKGKGAGYRFCERHFLSERTLQGMSDMAQQFWDNLANLGMLPHRRSHQPVAPPFPSSLGPTLPIVPWPHPSHRPLQARAVNAEGPGEWSEILWIESGAAALPNTPVGLGVTPGSVASREFELAWAMPHDNRSMNVLGYSLLLTAGSEALPTYVALAIASNCTMGCSALVAHDAVRPDVSYSIALAAQNAIGQSQPTAPIVVQTLTAAPDPVTNLRVLVLGGSSMRVTWEPPAANGHPLLKHVVTACDAQLGPPSCTPTDALAPAAELTLTSLAPGRNFTVSVVAVNGHPGGGASDAVQAAGFYTTHDVPNRVDRPFRATPELVGLDYTSAINVMWVAPYDNGRPIGSYNLSIDLGTPDAEWHSVPHLPGQGVYQYTKTGLYPGTQHTFAVTALNELGAGPMSDAYAQSTVAARPGTPPAPALDLVTISTIRLSIAPPAYDGGTPISTYQMYDSSIGGVATLAAGQMDYTITHRNPAKEYRFRVRAVTTAGVGLVCYADSAHCSAFSEYTIVPSMASLYPNMPINAHAGDVGPRSFRLSWSMPPDPLSDGVLRYVLSVVAHGISPRHLPCISVASHPHLACICPGTSSPSSPTAPTARRRRPWPPSTPPTARRRSRAAARSAPPPSPAASRPLGRTR